MTLQTPIGLINRQNPFAELSDEKLLQSVIEREEETGFINPVAFREIEDRGLYSVFSKMMNPGMSPVLTLTQ